MQKTCPHCRQEFKISDQDLAFLNKVSPVFAGKQESIPPPQTCPDCRLQQHLAFRNERKLYHRKCDLTGKQIISVYAPDSPQKIYAQNEWWSDAWNARDFARDIDWNRPFFAQFQDLFRSVPLPHIHMESCENFEYGNFCWGSSDCYLTFGSDGSRNCYYSHLLYNCTDCVDCSYCKECTYCYELLDSEKCYRCFYSKELLNCESVDFSIDCKSCKNCFGCTGLRHKQYCLFNEQLTEKEYKSRLVELIVTQEAIDIAGKKAMDLWKKQPRLAARLVQCEDCTGDNLLQCKSCTDCFDGVGGRDCVRVQNMPGQSVDCHDIYAAGHGAELCYNGYCIASHRTHFSFLIYPTGDNVLYSALCASCNNIFGCVGLQHQEYCIFNKQYSKEEYERLVPQLIAHMRKTGEWGEFFPVTLSPFAYNETVANEFFPLSQEEAARRGWDWRVQRQEEDYLGPETPVPSSIARVDESITQKILRCHSTGKLYKIIPQELSFYRDHGLPVPILCPDERHRQRMEKRNPRKLWKRTCDSCHTPISTTYAPDRHEIVYCEACYTKAVA